MAAEFESGVFVRKPAWHGLGHVIQDYVDRDTMMGLAGHNWDVQQRPITADGTEIKGWYALKRSDTGAVISVMRESYKPIQNRVLWDIVDAIVAQPNVKYETAGVLRGGAILWVLALLDEPWKVPGDDSATVAYIKASTAHDGSGELCACGTNVRVVCANTWMMAIREAKKLGMYYSFRHTENVQRRMDEAKDALTVVRKHFEVYKELTTELAKHPVSTDGVTEFLMRFIPDPRPEERTNRAVEWVNDARAKYAAILGGATVAEAHKRTAYGLWCAGVEFLDHERAYRSNETYFNRCTTPNRFKDQLGKLALEVAS
jgi:phage/plasmid-like protein (TIGR03299 family)